MNWFYGTIDKRALARHRYDVVSDLGIGIMIRSVSS